MSAERIEQAAEELAKHDPTTVRLDDGLHNACRCTWVGDLVTDENNWMVAQRHIAQALADAGLVPTEMEKAWRDPEDGTLVQPRSIGWSRSPHGLNVVRRYVTPWEEVVPDDH